MIGGKDIKRGDSVYVGGNEWASVLRVVADRTVQLSGGRWVRESELDYYGANCWRYHPEPVDCDEPISAREVLESYGAPEGIIDEALMAHAHELAEDLRLNRWSYMSSSPSVTVDRAADRIDPEVKD